MTSHIVSKKYSKAKISLKPVKLRSQNSVSRLFEQWDQHRCQISLFCATRFHFLSYIEMYYICCHCNELGVPNLVRSQMFNILFALLDTSDDDSGIPISCILLYLFETSENMSTYKQASVSTNTKTTMININKCLTVK